MRNARISIAEKPLYVLMKRFFVYILFCTSFISLAQKPYAPNGEIFTPKGDLRILIVFAGFENDSNQYFNNWPSKNDLPNYIIDGKLEDGFYNSFDQFSNVNKSIDNLSQVYYEMSDKKSPFRIVADVYPKTIILDIEKVQRKSWGGCNELVLKTMKEQDPGFDWSPYDRGQNNPNFKFDNSVSQPDKKPDFVIIIYRYKHDWKLHPIQGMNRWQGTNGGSSTLGVRPFEYNGYTITSDGFHLNSNSATGVPDIMGMFKHELGHELFSGPHYMGANGVYGEYFYALTGGWGSTVYATMNNTFNAWESWLLGWNDITYDLNSAKQNGTYELRDFATTGDVIRLKVPGTTDQYLWIENHQKVAYYDENSWKGKLKDHPKGSPGIGEMDKGLYMYVENMLNDRNKINTSFVYDMDKVNGIYLLNAQGNYDYDIPTDFIQTDDYGIYWNNKVYYFNRTIQNPFGGTNPFYKFKFDINGNGRIDHRSNFNHGKGEDAPIVMEMAGDSAYLFYQNHATRNSDAKKYRRSLAFVVGDTISISNNPPVTNYPKFHQQKDSIEPVFFNPLRIRILSEKSGVMKLSLKLDHPLIDNNLRIAGNVGIQNDGVEYRVAKKKKITIDKSGIPNCLKRSKEEFIRPTYFILYDSAALVLNNKATVSVYDNSRVDVLPGAKLSLIKKNIFSIQDSSIVVFEEGSHFFYHKRAKIKMGAEAILIMKRGTILNDSHTLTRKIVISGKKIRSKRFKRLLKENT